MLIPLQYHCFEGGRNAAALTYLCTASLSQDHARSSLGLASFQIRVHIMQQNYILPSRSSLFVGVHLIKPILIVAERCTCYTVNTAWKKHEKSMALSVSMYI